MPIDGHCICGSGFVCRETAGYGGKTDLRRKAKPLQTVSTLCLLFCYKDKENLLWKIK